MRKIRNLLPSEGKSSKNTQSRKGKSFGYQMLGFGGGSGAPTLDFDYLIVGGGGGGAGSQAAGAGAGGFRTSYPGGTKIALESGAAVDVGAGGGAS